MPPTNLPKLDFNITNRCNFRCIHCCFRSGEWAMNEFNPVKIQKILEEFKKLGGWRIDITGGEPLIREDVKEIIKIGKNLDLKIELVTNGSLLSRKKLQAFKRLGLDAVAISLDGSDYKTYAKIRKIGRKTFNKIINNIKHCVQLGFYTKINTVVFNSNFEDLLNITKLGINLKVNEHGLYYFSPIGRGREKNEEVANPLAWLRILRERFLKLDNKIKLSVEVPVLEREIAKNLKTSCYMEDPWHLQILPDGNVYPCAIMASWQKPFGNLYKQSLKQIWRDKKLWKGEYFRKEIEPLFKKFGGCVYYPTFSKLVKNGRYQFVCLCRKFKIRELLPINNTYGKNKTKR